MAIVTKTEDQNEEGDDEEDSEEEGDDEDEDGEVGKKVKAKKPTYTPGRGAKKWETLYHNGPCFPPEYEPLPSHIKLVYDGTPVALPPESEEAAMFYAVKLETQHARNPIFNNNFFSDFKKLLANYPPMDMSAPKLEKFEKLDFRPMYEYWKSLKDAEAERKKALAPSARKKEVEERKKAEAEMKTCIVDGIEQKVGNVMVEPPALFLGRGEHPKTGRIKTRVMPEQITINHTLNDPNHPPPPPPKGHKWKAVVEDKNTTWLAFWQENINAQHKYMFLDPTSNFKTNADREKYEKARRLDKTVAKLRKNYTNALSSKSRKERQVATVIWLIDVYSLRVGNEKKEDEADTYGACSLLSEHCTLIEPNIVKLSFLGKDSMKFEDELICPEQVFKNFKMFGRSHAKDKKSGKIQLKKGTEPIFEVVDPSDINRWLQSRDNGGMQGLSAKVFRTYNASTTFQALLNKTEEWLSSRITADERALTPANLRLAYNEANRQVAILCNHQKTVNAVVHEKSMQRTEEKIFALRYERFKELQKLKNAGKPADLKKQYPAKEHDWAKHWKTILEDVDLDPEEIKAHEEKMISDKKARIQSSFERAMKEQEYLEGLKKAKKDEGVDKKAKGKKKAKNEDDKEEVVNKSLKSKEQVRDELKALDERLKELEKERKSGRSLAENVNVASCAKKILGKVEAIKKQEAERINKENTKEVALGTSKLNYIDPRITVAWLKKWDQRLIDLAGAPKKKSGSKTKKEDPDASSDKKSKAKAKKEVKDEKPDQRKNQAVGSEKMELGLQIMSIGQFFPMTMQKKFKWAATGDDDDKDLSPDWVFVENSESKMRSMNSAQKKQIEEGAPDEADKPKSILVKKKATAKASTNADFDSDDEPLGEKASAVPSTSTKPNGADDSDLSEDDAPPNKASGKGNSKKRSEPHDDEEEPLQHSAVKKHKSN
ncbi:hypothetical protein K437DRAFT_222391 [Tilletiaria anomala UBC 951]|uniref:DNA topoisomerase 1 n=1 Tax=Tilletiaria anomala (strain ATCC 24038 / CBS 436.72 / UBC 951) TaxID=1037660 RepID=A0A066WDL8_TILAU|nr:uncharacterized protein K437DRAFT_222391 [Tilletiaria anomala UBC 951]KDN49199.1 hypothetical protein K437DRAFT_222391 [Tilletiaria anomala UBC 951]